MVRLALILTAIVVVCESNPRSLVTGAVLGCIETVTLGQPLEVWKTRNGQMHNESAFESLRAIYRTRGPKGFWVGLEPRLVESTTKGAILVYSREVLLKSCSRLGVRGTAAAVIAGVGSGVAQTLVMGPMTLLVVAANHDVGPQGGLLRHAADIYREQGPGGFFVGSGPMALRQATNWGSRQGISDAMRAALIRRSGGTPLSVAHEILCGSIAGVLSTWNQVHRPTLPPSPPLPLPVFERSSPHILALTPHAPSYPPLPHSHSHCHSPPRPLPPSLFFNSRSASFCTAQSCVAQEGRQGGKGR